MDDDDSLFGSPPPSPGRGRSPSPALALPSASTSINLAGPMAQNVGTIALPGSQCFSELPVHPLALSLSFPPLQSEGALRPPATVPTRNSTSPCVIPTLMTAHTDSLKRKSTKRSNLRPSIVTRRPTPPPIHLPDPSDPRPIPPNLLRNQPGLLGTAGLVAGVRPANFALRAANQGSSAANPILIEDTPVVNAPIVRSGGIKRKTHKLDLSLLPAPSNRDIVAVLMEQKDTIPLLQNIIKFLSQRQSQTESSSRSATPSGPEPGPSQKRRKLRHVPAGADLWDVPFPFNEGEGPHSYRDDWEREHGKKLVAELVALLKSAARKAALKNVMKGYSGRNAPSDAELASLGSHYSLDTLFYGKQPTEVLSDSSNASQHGPAESVVLPPTSSSMPEMHIPPPDPAPAPASFDHLITSLLSAAPAEQFSVDVPGSPAPSSVESVSSVDSGLFDTWMDIFQAFPVPSNGDELLSAADGNAGFNLQLPGASSFDDLSMIDPLLLGLPPMTASSTSAVSADSACPSLTASPIVSSRSFSVGPMTPSESGWTAEPVGGGYRKDTEQEVLSLLQSLSHGIPVDKGKGKQQDQGGGDLERRPPDTEDVEFARLKTVPIVGSLTKAELLGRAKERREALVQEIAQTRISLWQCTVEGAVLAGLVQNYTITET